jgi:hypothetical protein
MHESGNRIDQRIKMVSELSEQQEELVPHKSESVTGSVHQIHLEL